MMLELPADARVIDVEDLGLPANWQDDETATQKIGMDWLNSMASLGLWVPSFVEPLERNLLLNTTHADYSKIRLTIERNPFEFDARLF